MDTLSGGDGDDALDGGTAANVTDGGEGYDACSDGFLDFGVCERKAPAPAPTTVSCAGRTATIVGTPGAT